MAICKKCNKEYQRTNNSVAMCPNCMKNELTERIKAFAGEKFTIVSVNGYRVTDTVTYKHNSCGATKTTIISNFLRIKGNSCNSCKNKNTGKIKSEKFRKKATKNLKDKLGDNYEIINEVQNTRDNIYVLDKINNKIISKTYYEFMNSKDLTKCQRMTQGEFVEFMKKQRPDVIVKGVFKNKTTPVELECSICGYGSDGSWKATYSNLKKYKMNGCHMCKTITQQQIMIKLKEEFPHVTVVDISKCKSNDKIKLYCNKHELDFEVFSGSFIYRDACCPQCGLEEQKIKKTKSNDDFLKELYEVHKGEYIALEDYKGKGEKIKFKHIKCNRTFDMRPTSILTQGHECPHCMNELTVGKLHLKVVEFLTELGYKLNFENKCSIVPINPKTNYQLPYDIEIDGYNIIIEVHGKQHYKYTPHLHYNDEKNFYSQRVRDRYKRMYAKSKGYTFIEIPYSMEYKDKYKNVLLNVLEARAN